jgi:hypothetical protein
VRPGRLFLVVALAGYGPGLIALHALAPRPSFPEASTFRMAAAQAVVLLAWAPALGRPDRAFDPRAWVRLGVLSGVGIVALLVATWPGVPALEGLVLLGFAALLLGLRDGLRTAGLGERGARLVPLALGAASLTTLAWTGPVIESFGDASAGVDLALRINPLAAIAGGILDIDWARLRPVTYDAFVGQYYPFSYPGPVAGVLGWVVAGALGAASSVGIARRIQSRRVQSLGPPDAGR